jgi:L-ribulokinase
VIGTTGRQISATLLASTTSQKITTGCPEHTVITPSPSQEACTMPESNARAKPPEPNGSDAPYLIGLDYGTESARAILMRADGNAVLATAVHRYRRGVIERELNGVPMPRTWALQDADDYLLAAEDIIRRVGAALPAGASVAGLSIAFTSSTPMPVDAQGEPLSRRYPDWPHAYVKLWKHRAAAEHTERFQTLPGLDYCGGSSSPEWLPAKALELAAEAPALWAEAARFLEAGDWLTAQLCGETLSEVCSASHAGYKAHFRAGEYPPQVQAALNGRLGDGRPQPLGTAAGTFSAEWQRRTGLPSRPLLAVSSIDAHAAASCRACTATRRGRLALATS